MQSLKFDLRPSILLIALLVCLLAVKVCSSQNPLPTLIVSGQDTSASITTNQFDVVLFSFVYIKDIEQRNNNLSNQLTRSDSIRIYLVEQLTLERAKFAQQDSMVINLETIITKTKRQARRSKFKNIMLELGLGVAVAVEAALIVTLLTR